MNSRNKGAAGEREWANWLCAEGYKARRGQQYSGNPDAPDVVCDLPFHFEVKRVERLNLLQAMIQATADCGPKMPVVAHRLNRGEWQVTMLASDWIKLVREFVEAQKIEEVKP